MTNVSDKSTSDLLRQQAEEKELIAKINDLLVEAGYTLQAVNNPVIRVIKVNEGSDSEARPEVAKGPKSKKPIKA